MRPETNNILVLCDYAGIQRKLYKGLLEAFELSSSKIEEVMVLLEKHIAGSMIQYAHLIEESFTVDELTVYAEMLTVYGSLITRFRALEAPMQEWWNDRKPLLERDLGDVE